MHVESKADYVDKSDVALALLAHYDRHARSLPWRVMPGQGLPDPYRVWLSEIMLQQTTVAAVIPYFQNFTTRWPNVQAMAAADDADVMAAWAGLGYYARARNLLKCARRVSSEYHGRFPDNEAELRSLPGIGPYTAAAIAAIAFGRDAVVVDANVERVVSRLFAIATPLPAAKPEIRAATLAITPAGRAGDFAQAMMDLGAGLCSVRNPQCGICPLARFCDAYATERSADFPVKAPKLAKPHRTGTAYWIEREGAVWLVTRPEKGMLAGMRALPDSGWSVRGDGDAPPPLSGPWQRLETPVAHVFTHFSLTLNLALYRGMDFDMLPKSVIWWPVADLAAAGLPTLYRKAAELIRRVK